MANKNTGKILISLIIGAVVAYYAYDMYAKQQKQIVQQNQLIQVMKLRDEQLAKKTYDYFVPIKDIDVGTTVTVMDIKKITVSEKNKDAIVSQNKIIGSVLLRPVKADQILTNEDFISVDVTPKAGLREGYRALTVSTESLDGLALDMKEGSLIDIFSKSKGEGKILSKIKILSLVPFKTETVVDKAANAVANEPVEKPVISITQAKSVTFEVPINRVQDFVEIYSSGKIMLVMRPVGDDTVIKPKKEEKEKAKTTSSNSQNVNYNSAKLPSLPVVQTYEDPSINELPSPIKAGSYKKSVEIIEANSRTQVNF